MRVKIYCTIHDALLVDVYCSVRVPIMGRMRYSVLVPKGALKPEFMAAAVDLAIYVRAQHPGTEVRVDAGIYSNTLQVRRPGAVRPNADIVNWNCTADYDAVNRASELLKAIDVDLWEKMSKGTAFYFTTPTRQYIWYPTNRSIVALEDDAPKYVCVHSKDYAVETNRFDWALTMRTYLLADEQHFRSTANFHPEWSVRGEHEHADNVHD